MPTEILPIIGAREADEIEPDSSIVLNLYLAAQGHDLYEDTHVSSQQIIDLFGVRVHSWIAHLTNRHGDQNRAAYLDHIQATPEEVRLIKLGDLIDNSASCAYGLHDLGAEWVSSFLLPVVNEMREVIGRTAFVKYPQTARRLSAVLEFSCARLRQNTLKFLSPSTAIALE